MSIKYQKWINQLTFYSSIRRSILCVSTPSVDWLIISTLASEETPFIWVSKSLVSSSHIDQVIDTHQEREGKFYLIKMFFVYFNIRMIRREGCVPQSEDVNQTSCDDYSIDNGIAFLLPNHFKFSESFIFVILWMYLNKAQTDSSDWHRPAQD